MPEDFSHEVVRYAHMCDNMHLLYFFVCIARYSESVSSWVKLKDPFHTKGFFVTRMFEEIKR